MLKCSASKIIRFKSTIQLVFDKQIRKSYCIAAFDQNKSLSLSEGNQKKASISPIPSIKMDETLTAYALMFASTAVMGFGISTVLNKFNLPYIWNHEVDRKSKRHGGELVAKVLKSHGVKEIFCLSGGHISPILCASEKSNIRIIDTRHEVAAVFAADAVARMTGRIGVAAVTAGPGLTNTITAVKNAQMAESPILLMGGAAATISKGRGALQDIEQLSLFKPLCKYVATVTSVREIIPTLRKAIHIAQSGTPGPVFVEFPVDVLYPYEMVAKEIVPSSPPKTMMQKVINWYLNNYLNNLFAGAWQDFEDSPIKPNIPMADSKTVEKCAQLLMESKKPVIVIGSQATLPPTPVEDLRKSLERMGIPCFLGGMSRGLLGKDSPIQMRQKRRDALKEADVIILAGAACDFRLSYGRVLSKKAKIIAVNRSKEQLLKNSDIYWKPTVPVIGDVGTFMSDLSSSISGYSCDKEWVETLRNRDIEKEEINKEMAQDVPDTHLNPLKVFYDLEKVLPDNAILVADGGDFVATAAYTLKPRGPLQWLDPGAFGTLGVGGGFALGAKISRPESEVWLIYGDGSFGYSISEFDTYNRHNTPVLALIGNDAGWTQIAREQVPMFGSSVSCDLLHCDYHKVVEGLGARGMLLGKDDDLIKGFEKARQVYKTEGKSVVINALIGKSKFREGSISV